MTIKVNKSGEGTKVGKRKGVIAGTYEILRKKRLFTYPKDKVWKKRKERTSTGVPQFDEALGGGLPKGITVAYGDAGSGKSMFGRLLAEHHGKKAMYIFTETDDDAPTKGSGVTPYDYTDEKPKWDRALMELMTLIDGGDSDIVVIDSATAFFSISGTAVPETQLRKCMLKLHTTYRDKVIYVTSEMAGRGFNKGTSGGPGVEHRCSMLMEFEHVLIDYPNQEKAYDTDIGDEVYCLRVVKDKQGRADTKRWKVVYDKDEDSVTDLIRVEKRSRVKVVEDDDDDDEDGW